MRTSGQKNIEPTGEMAKEWEELAKQAEARVKKNIDEAVESFDTLAVQLEEEKERARHEKEIARKKKVIEEIDSLEERLKKGKDMAERMDAADKLLQKIEGLKELLDDIYLNAVARQKLDSLSWNENKEVAGRAIEIMSEKAKSIMEDYGKAAERKRKANFAPVHAQALVELWLSVAKHKDDKGNNILIDDYVEVIHQQGTANELVEEHSYIYGALSELLRYKHNLASKRIELTKEVLEVRVGADIDAKQLEDLVKAWQASASEEFDPEEKNVSTELAVYENLKALARLEAKQPGISKELTRDFGVKDFARYPEEMLLGQVKEKENTELPYGIVLLPRSDHNGAFYSLRIGLGEMFAKLKGKYNIIAIEAGSVIEVGKRFSKLEKLHTQKGKTEPAFRFSFAYIGGHGDEDSIQFGDKGDLSRLKIEHLGGRGIQRSKKFFIENPSIMLASCSTGIESGIGQQLSEMLGAKVIAPNQPTLIKSIGVDFDNSGKPIFSITYGNGDLPGLTVAAMSYEKGELKEVK